MSGLAEALAEHRHFTYNLTAERVLCAGCDWSGEIDADRTAHLAHRWYAERLGRLAGEIEDPRIQWPGMQRRRMWADALRAALTERGDRG